VSVQAASLKPVAATEKVSWPWGLWGVISVGLIYGVVYSVMRMAISPNLPQDDVTANIFAQTFELGYQVRQPPLYEWLLWSVQNFTGPVGLSFLIIKFTLLTAIFIFLYLAATRIFTDRRWATIAGLSPLFLYEIAWNYHEGVTQTAVMMCMIAASFWAFMRVVERGFIGDYALFGVIAGLGVLSKYIFLCYLFILLVCALFQPALRNRVLNWRILVAVVAILVVVAPFAYWLVVGRKDLVALYQTAVAPPVSSWWKGRAIGLALALYSPLAFLFSLILILPVFFRGTLHEGWFAVRRAVHPSTWNRSEADWRLFLLHMTIGAFVFLILGALLGGATNFRERYMHTFFLLTPLWMLALVESGGDSERRVITLARLLLIVTVLIVPLRAYDLLHSRMHVACRKCRIGLPYDGLAQALKAHGFQSGTLIAVNRYDAGNLRRLFPEARIVCLRRPTYGPPLRKSDLAQPAVVVWRESEGTDLPKDAAPFIAQIGGVANKGPEELEIPWKRGDHSEIWRIAMIQPSGMDRTPARSAVH
jgi:4-amino-4-deoxy-L-arabinose transferase-like glycosyltransferase